MNNTYSRSAGGYLTVDYYSHQPSITKVLFNAWKDLKYDEIDYNAENEIGVSYGQYTINHGVRQSANGAFLRPIRGKRPNLTIETEAHVTKIIIDQKSKQAIGVEYTSAKDKLSKNIFARKEVIVSAGVFDTPKLLMLSGIGPEKELNEAKIEIINDLPVGQNLQDHVGFSTQSFELPNELSTIKSGKDVLNDAVYWLNTHEGPTSGPGTQIVAFSQTKFEHQSGVPDILYVQSTFVKENFKINPNYTGGLQYFPGSYYSGISISTFLLNPKSRGSVSLNKTDPIYSPPLIQLNYLTASEDMDRITEGALQAKKIFETPTFKQYGLTELKRSVPKCDKFEFGSAEYYKCLVKISGVSFNHHIGTCKMGPATDSTTVVNPRLQVHGIKGLRVVDASVMPTIPTGNTNAPVIMIAEKASDMIKEDWSYN